MKALSYKRLLEVRSLCLNLSVEAKEELNQLFSWLNGPSSDNTSENETGKFNEWIQNIHGISTEDVLALLDLAEQQPPESMSFCFREGHFFSLPEGKYAQKGTLILGFISEKGIVVDGRTVSFYASEDQMEEFLGLVQKALLLFGQYYLTAQEVLEKGGVFFQSPPKGWWSS